MAVTGWLRLGLWGFPPDAHLSHLPEAFRSLSVQKKFGSNLVTRVESSEDLAALYANYSAYILSENANVDRRLTWFFALTALLAGGFSTLYYGCEIGDACKSNPSFSLTFSSGLPGVTWGGRLDSDLQDRVETLLLVIAGVGAVISAAALLAICAAYLAMSRINHMFKKFLKNYLIKAGYDLKAEVQEAFSRLIRRPFPYFKKQVWRNIEVYEFPLLLGAGSRTAIYLGHFYGLALPGLSFLFWVYVVAGMVWNRGSTHLDFGLPSLPTVAFIVIGVVLIFMTPEFIIHRNRSFFTNYDDPALRSLFKPKQKTTDRAATRQNLKPMAFYAHKVK